MSNPPGQKRSVKVIPSPAPCRPNSAGRPWPGKRDDEEGKAAAAAVGGFEAAPVIPAYIILYFFQHGIKSRYSKFLMGLSKVECDGNEVL